MRRREGRVLTVVSVNIVLYAVCYQLQRPIEPYLVDRLGAGRPGSDAAANYAWLQSFFNLVQTVGAPVVGRLLDACGARNTFAAVFLASALSYEMLARCSTMHGLYASKLPSLLQHAFLVAQAVVARAVPPERRAAALGRLMMMYTMGAAVGPGLGGYLGAAGDFRLGARIAAAGSLVSVALIVVLLPPDDDIDGGSGGDGKQNTAGETKPTRPATATRYRRLLSATWPQLSTKAAMGAASSLYQAVSPVVLKERFGVAPATMGAVMSAQAVTNAAVAGLALGPVTRALSEHQLVRGCLACLALGFLTLIPAALDADTSRSTGYLPWVALGVTLSVFSHTLGTVLTSMSTARVGGGEKGALLGLEHGVFSGVRVGGPALGSVLFQGGGAAAVAAACAAIATGTWAAWTRAGWLLAHAGRVTQDAQTRGKKVA